MKLIRTENERLTFFLTRWEKPLLVKVLEMYPLVPPAHHRLTKNSEKLVQAEDQRLLDEAVAEQRKENKNRVQKFLKDSSLLNESATGVQLVLTREEVEWLLQVLNDVRVGAWLALGEPEEIHTEPTEENSAILFAMEASGHFQSELLTALGYREPGNED